MPTLQSSAVSYVNYRAPSRELDIKFTTGETHTYLNVPMNVYVGLVEAESAASFYNERIRDQYRFRKRSRPH